MKSQQWQHAAAFAARGHEHEKRDDGKTPYFSHPARVAMLVALWGCADPDTLAAAYLHDTMENTDEGYDDMAEHFGADVADLVVALTKNMMLPSKERERDYLARLKKASWRARLIKLGDMFDNYTDALQGLKEHPGEERKKCKEALDLAAPDAKSHPETRRALGDLRKLLKKGKKA